MNIQRHIDRIQPRLIEVEAQYARLSREVVAAMADVGIAEPNQALVIDALRQANRSLKIAHAAIKDVADAAGGETESGGTGKGDPVDD